MEPLLAANHFVAIGSGKGGVGKSTVSVNLAVALAQQGHRVGLIDADIYGPNVPLMFNLTRRTPARFIDIAWNKGHGPTQWEPLEKYGVKIMSVGFLTGEEQAIWNADLIQALSTQLVHRVNWGDLDYLLADLPPGSADINQRFVKSMSISGAIIVVTPQDVAHLDAKKAIEMYQHSGVKVLGAVENMSGLACPHCSEMIDVFHRVDEARSIWKMGVEKMAQIPLDPEMSKTGDAGKPVVVALPDSPQTASFHRLAENLVGRLSLVDDA